MDKIDVESELERLVMDCPELAGLESNLSQFNIFRVLRAGRHELRHSNMLAWLFDPEGNHGLDDSFLRRYLMKVLRRARGESSPRGWISPVAVDVLDIERIEIHREFDSIDVLFEIHRKHGAPWVICIENKVDSKQGEDQLERYRRRVEDRFEDAERRLYIFLTRNEEMPSSDEYMESSYADVHAVLSACLHEREDVIGAEPRILVRNYLELLGDDFMSENANVKLAKRIYMQHRAALDFIFENKIDPMFEVSSTLQEVLETHSDELEIIPFASSKSYVRFCPKSWAINENSGGSAWGKGGYFVVCEITLSTKKIELHIVAGDTPDEWADDLWERAERPPFKQEWKERPRRFVKPYKARSSLSVDELAELDPDEAKARLLAWIQKETARPKYIEAVEILAKLIKKIPEAV